MADIRMDGVYYSRSDMVDGEPKAGAKPCRILAVDLANKEQPVAAEHLGSVNTFTKDGYYFSSRVAHVYDLIEYVAPQYVPLDDLCDEWQFGWMLKEKDGKCWVYVPNKWSRDYMVLCDNAEVYGRSELFRDFLLSKDNGKTWQPCGKLKSPA